MSCVLVYLYLSSSSFTLMLIAFLVLFSQAGGMDRASQLPKLRDNESEYMLGYVFAVSGPGKSNTSTQFLMHNSLIAGQESQLTNL